MSRKTLDELYAECAEAERVADAALEREVRANEVWADARASLRVAETDLQVAAAALQSIRLAIKREQSAPKVARCPELAPLFWHALWPSREACEDDIVTIAEKSTRRGKVEVQLWRWLYGRWDYATVYVSSAGVPLGKRKPAIDPGVLAECIERCAQARKENGR